MTAIPVIGGSLANELYNAHGFLATECVMLIIFAVALLDTFLHFLPVVCSRIVDTTHHEDGRIIDHISRKTQSVVPTTTMINVEHAEVVTHMVDEVMQHIR